MMQKLEIKASIQIQKPSNVVFEGIADPKGMSNYFISKSSGRMEEGKTLMWGFPEFDMEFPVRVGKVRQNEYISFYWPGEAGDEMFVEITLEQRPDQSTVVTVTEKEKELNEAGLRWLMGNTEGWANFLASMKAYLEYGINLRKGAFLYRFESK